MKDSTKDSATKKTAMPPPASSVKRKAPEVTPPAPTSPAPTPSLSATAAPPLVDPATGTSTEQPTKKRKRESRPNVVLAEEFDLATHAEIHPIKKGKIRSVKLSVPDSNSAVRIQFSNGPGYMPPKYNCEANDHGKVMLTFTIPNDKEKAAMDKLTADIIKVGQKNKRAWWPSGNITDEQVASGFVPLTSTKPKFKLDEYGQKILDENENPIESGEFWATNMKLVIPMEKGTGEVSKLCKVLDSDGSPITIYDLPGSKWGDVVAEFGDIYFSGRHGWGFGPKKLANIQLSKTDYYNARETSDFVPKKSSAK